MASGTESTEMKRDDVHQVAPAVAAVVLRDTQDQSTLVSPKRRIVIFLSLALALFVSFLDQTSVSTSMPAMGQDLDATSTISWVGTSFLIANTAFQLVNGRLSDIFGRKGCLMTSLTLLAFGDLLCGFAQTSIQLFIFRAVAGIGAGGVNSLVMVIVSDMTTLRERGKYQGFLETFIALGNGIGPLVGGVFSEKVTWRWSFWFVAPVSAVTLVNLFLLLPQPKVDGNWKSRLLMVDFMGMSLSMGMILFLLIPISGGGTAYSWNSPMVISFLVIAVCLFIGFLLVESKIAKIPVMPLYIFKKRASKIMFTHNFITGIVYYIDLYYLPVYFQHVRGYNPITSGILILPLILSFSVGSSSSGVIIAKLGKVKPIITIGYILWVAGAGGKISISINSPIWMLCVVQIVEGLGFGFAFQPVMIALLSCVSKEDRAVVTSTRNFLRTVGGAIGIAVAAVVINNVVLDTVPNTNPMELTSILATQSNNPLVQKAYMQALHIIFIFCVPLMGCCLLSTFLVGPILLETPALVVKVDVEAGVAEDRKIVLVDLDSKTVIVRESRDVENKS